MVSRQRAIRPPTILRERAACTCKVGILNAWKREIAQEEIQSPPTGFPVSSSRFSFVRTARMSALAENK